MNEVSKPDRAKAAPSAAAAAPLVVGVGASAGGVEAISALLRGLPGDAPVGLVVLQHLDSAHSSALPDLLAPHTSLKVITAADGALVEAGQVHVTPPDAELRIINGRLQVVPRPAGATQLPIDTFFDSLARDRGPGAAGVVLSGQGADGSQGVCALKRAGASTFAQDKTALHGDMPAAATATGCVDHVLTPAEIAEQLLQQTEEVTQAREADELAIEQVCALLRQTTGSDFSTYKASTVKRRLNRRVALGNHGTLARYLEVLTRDPSEVKALSEDLLIHVTSFFRDVEVFTALSKNVLPRLVSEKQAGEPLRVWVPGCSTGEEVYSLVIALSEALSATDAKVQLKMFGTDVSEGALEKARAAWYPESITSVVSPERLQRFFQRTGAGFQLRKEVRDLCVFARQDVTRDPPFANLDLVSCRNVMIYLSSQTQRQLVPTLHYSLRTGGVLLLGAAETTGAHPGFETIDGAHRIYRRVARPLRAELARAAWHTAASAPRSSSGRPSPQGEVLQQADRAVLGACAPPGVVVNDDLQILQFRGATGLFLEPAPGAATLELLRLAREELRVDLHAAIEKARQTGQRVQSAPLLLGRAEGWVSVDVLPLLPPAVPERHFVVLFREQAVVADSGQPREQAQRVVEESLRAELTSTRAYLQSIIEQLEAGNEELRAVNEEVLSSRQEIQTSKQEMETAREELRATNEELSTVTGAMAERDSEAARASDDLTNVLNSVGIAIVILGTDARVRRFTPAAGQLLNLIPGDVGRPISDIKPNLRAPDLLQLVNDVLEHLAPRERTVTDEAGRWYQLSVRPYFTANGRVEGAVLTVVDVDAIQRGKTLLAEALDYAEGIVDTVRDPLLVLDEHRKVRSANRSFYRKFQITREELEGKQFDQLGNPRWVPPVLIAALDRLAAQHATEEARLEDTPSRFAGRSMLVSGRPLLRAGQPPWVLLAFEDLTEQMRSDAAVRRSERALREMLGAASEAILIANGNGLITYANEMAARTFGYPLEELTGMSIERLVPEERRAESELAEELFTPPHGAPAAPVMGGNREVRGRKKDGTLFPAEVGLSVMEGEQGPLVVAFVSDVTARHEAEARINTYKKNLQEMAFDATVVEERQRRKLAMDLHDNIGQTLALSQIRLKAAQAALAQNGETAGARDLSEGIKLIATAINDTRELTFELSPPVLYDLGLPSAISWLGEQLESQHHLHVSVESDEPFEKLEDETAGLLFRAVRECLTNVVKHARTHEAQVSIHRHDHQLTVVVADQGAGFDSEEKLKKYGAAKGFGLFSVREQIMRLGGTFEASSSPEQGTRITLQIPLNDRRSVPPAVGEAR